MAEQSHLVPKHKSYANASMQNQVFDKIRVTCQYVYIHAIELDYYLILGKGDFLTISVFLVQGQKSVVYG